MTPLTRVSRSLLLGLAALQAACVGLGGERIRLQHEPLARAMPREAPEIRLVVPVTDMRPDPSRIGVATITAFAIGAGDVESLEPVTDAIAFEVADALAAAGWLVRVRPETDALAVVRPEHAASAPVARVTLQRLHFRNYNAFYPLVPTWGEVELAFTLSDASGEIVYARSFSGEGDSWCLTGHCAFTTATREAMTNLLAGLAAASASEEFAAALGRAASPAAAEPPASARSEIRP